MTQLRELLRALPALLRIGVAEIVAYRSEMVIWILSATMPLVMLALWNAAAAAGPIAGYGQADFARYFAITLLVRQLTGCWVLWELNYLIRTGELSPWLLRPISPLWYNLASAISAMPMRVLVLLPILGALTIWRPEILFTPEPARVALFVVSVFLAFLLTWLIQAVFGMIAFWADQSQGLYQAWFAVWATLSGYFLPMALLPDGLSQVARVLPFHASLGAPIDVLMGNEARPLELVGVQLGWVVAAGALAVSVWRAGVRRYGAFGA